LQATGNELQVSSGISVPLPGANIALQKESVGGFWDCCFSEGYYVIFCLICIANSSNKAARGPWEVEGITRTHRAADEIQLAQGDLPHSRNATQAGDSDGARCVAWESAEEIPIRQDLGG
jgi:hypothetical protein